MDNATAVTIGWSRYALSIPDSVQASYDKRCDFTSWEFMLANRAELDRDGVDTSQLVSAIAVLHALWFVMRIFMTIFFAPTPPIPPMHQWKLLPEEQREWDAACNQATQIPLSKEDFIHAASLIEHAGAKHAEEPLGSRPPQEYDLLHAEAEEGVAPFARLFDDGAITFDEFSKLTLYIPTVCQHPALQMGNGKSTNVWGHEQNFVCRLLGRDAADRKLSWLELHLELGRWAECGFKNQVASNDHLLQRRCPCDGFKAVRLGNFLPGTPCFDAGNIKSYVTAILKFPAKSMGLNLPWSKDIQAMIFFGQCVFTMAEVAIGVLRGPPHVFAYWQKSWYPLTFRAEVAMPIFCLLARMLALSVALNSFVGNVKGPVQFLKYAPVAWYVILFSIAYLPFVPMTMECALVMYALQLPWLCYVVWNLYQGLGCSLLDRSTCVALRRFMLCSWPAPCKTLKAITVLELDQGCFSCSRVFGLIARYFLYPSAVLMLLSRLHAQATEGTYLCSFSKFELVSFDIQSVTGFILGSLLISVAGTLVLLMTGCISAVAGHIITPQFAYEAWISSASSRTVFLNFPGFELGSGIDDVKKLLNHGSDDIPRSQSCDCCAADSAVGDGRFESHVGDGRFESLDMDSV